MEASLRKRYLKGIVVVHSLHGVFCLTILKM